MPRQIRLATAIRKGIAKDGRQARYDLFVVNDQGQIIQCCALGAAYIGAGLVDTTKAYLRKPRGWEPFPYEPPVNQREALALLPDLRIDVPCPVKRCTDYDPRDYSDHGGLMSLVPHLNDDHRWSRERIADWVETTVRAAKRRRR